MKNKTENIVDALSREILDGVYPPGGRFPTELEAMERFGVSRVTVRRAYEILEKRHIIVRRPYFGTIVSNGLAVQTETIGEVGALVPLSHAFAQEFLCALNRAAVSENTLIVLSPPFTTGAEQSRAAIELVSRGIRNLVVWGMDSSLDFATFMRIRMMGCNMVFFDHLKLQDGADYVTLDNVHAIGSLLDLAVHDGCKHAVFIDTEGLDVLSNRNRRQAFIECCERLRLEHTESTLPWQRILKDGAPDVCRSFLNELPDAQETAIVAVNHTLTEALLAVDERHLHFYTIAIDAGKYPANVRFVLQPISEMASLCFELLRRQQKLGPDWSASDYLLKGKLFANQPHEKEEP